MRIAIIIGVRFEFNAGWNETEQEVDRERERQIEISLHFAQPHQLFDVLFIPV